MHVGQANFLATAREGTENMSYLRCNCKTKKLKWGSNAVGQEKIDSQMPRAGNIFLANACGCVPGDGQGRN